MELQIPLNADKKQAFQIVEEYVNHLGLEIDTRDESRPWGGFFCIKESDTQKFIELFFKNVAVSDVRKTEKLSPKILLVEKGKRLSWQYHHRRSEIWKVISGTVQVVQSITDEQTEPQNKNLNDIIILDKGERHRLIGADQWGIIAEIWQHTNPENPSNEEDIVRVEDDFGR